MTSKQQIVRWSEMPYTGHRKRGATVEHRVMLRVYDDGNVDVAHEVRSTDDRAPVPDEWREIDVWEVRHGRMNKLDRGQVLRA